MATDLVLIGEGGVDKLGGVEMLETEMFSAHLTLYFAR